jgi:Na+/phosphate symporter
MLIGWAVLLIALAGLVIYMISSNAKVAEVGRLLFFAGLLAVCLLLGGHVFKVG